MTSESSTPSKSQNCQQSPRRNVVAWLIFVCVTSVLTANVWLMWAQVTEDSRNRREAAFWALSHTGTTPEKRTEYFLKLVAEFNTEWRSATLEDLTLNGAALSGAQLESAVFSSCSFIDADFSDSFLDKAGLDNSDLSKADFSRARIRNATFFKSVLNSAEFRNADLLSTSFEQVRAHRAGFVAAKMGDAFLAMADLTGADLTAADLTGANLEAAILKDTDLALANLYGTHLVDADFTDSNWWRTRGLSSQQLDELTVKYPPSPNAADSRQRDFEIWLTKRIEEAGSPKTERPTDE